MKELLYGSDAGSAYNDIQGRAAKGYEIPAGVTDVRAMQNALGVRADGVWGRETEKAYAAVMSGGTRVLGASTTEGDNKKKSVNYQDYEGKIAPKTYTMLDTVAQDIALSELTPTEQKQAMGVVNALPQLYSGRQLNSAVQEMYNVIEKKGVNSFFSRHSPYNIKNTMVSDPDAEGFFTEIAKSRPSVHGVLGSGAHASSGANKTVQYGFITMAGVGWSMTASGGWTENTDESSPFSVDLSAGGGTYGVYAGVYAMSTSAPKHVLDDPNTMIFTATVVGGYWLGGGVIQSVIVDTSGNTYHGTATTIGVSLGAFLSIAGELGIRGEPAVPVTPQEPMRNGPLGSVGPIGRVPRE